MRVRTLLDETFTKADLELVLKGVGNGNVKICLSKDGEVIANVKGALESESRFVILVEQPKLWSEKHRNYMIYSFKCLMKIRNLWK